MPKPIPHRNWLLRVRRLLCVQYQELCQISTTNRDREKGPKFDDDERQALDTAISKTSEAIDAINGIVNLPKGS